MGDDKKMGFGQFVPGFDFLQGLASLSKGAASSLPQMPPLGSWVAPTLNVEELDKRIQELKTVQFWLESNVRALGATVQALEVQKMTLCALKGMNVQMGDMASGMAASLGAKMGAQPKAQTGAQASPEGAAAEPVDQLRMWSALGQQFQQIATTALADLGQHAGLEAARNLADQVAKETLNATKKAASNVMNMGSSGQKSSASATKTTAKKSVPKKA